MRRSAFSTVFAALVFALTCAPARATFCGPTDAISAIEKLTIDTYPGKGIPKHHSIDQSYIRQIDAQDGFGYSMTEEDAGMIGYFWNLDSGGWHYAGPFLPASWPAHMRAHFDNDMNSIGYGKPNCTNPKFTPRGSG